MNIYLVILGLCIVSTLAISLIYLKRYLTRKQQKHTHSNIRQLALLRELIAALQRHRGLSNVVLGGDKSMIQDLTKVCRQVDELILKAQQFDTTHRKAWEGLFDHWSRLRNIGSRDQKNNLQQHNQMICNSIFLIEDVANEIDLSGGRPELSYLPCIWSEVIQAAEWAGQARAIGAGIAAAGVSSAEQRIRMQFLYLKIEQLSRQAFSSLRHHAATHPQVNRFDIQASEKIITEFLACIQQDILGATTPTIDAKTYFQKATQSVDALLALVDAALAQLQGKK